MLHSPRYLGLRNVRYNMGRDSFVGGACTRKRWRPFHGALLPVSIFSACGVQANHAASPMPSATTSTRVIEEKKSGLFRIASCEERGRGSLVRRLTLNLWLKNGAFDTIEGAYESANENEGESAKLTGKVLVIGYIDDGVYSFALDNGAFAFGQDSEGGARTVPTSEIVVTARRVETKTSLGPLAGCTLSNVALLRELANTN